MTVYRIQNKRGRGPFAPGVTERWIDPDRTFFPEPQFAEQLRIAMETPRELNLAFACLTIDDLRKWASKTEYERLKKLGYYVCWLSVDAFWPLNDQVIVGRRKPYNRGYLFVNLYPAELENQK